jgi:DNA-binding transcriptional MerR regulator
LTTAAVEKKTGVSRSTIYFYIRQGLLPEPQKTPGGRSLYSDDHVDLLRKIGELKREGRSLPEIKQALSERVIRAQDSGVDLAAGEYDRVHSGIIQAAIEEFMAKGYKRTHVSTIIQKLGINPQLFYRHFPSKLQLLAECFRSFIEVGSATIEPAMQAYPDPAERAIRRLGLDRRGDELGSMLAAAIYSEGKLDPVDHVPVEDALENIMSRFASEIGGVRPPGSPVPQVSDLLVAYGLLGALSFQSMRASWGRGLTTADFLRAHLFIHLAILAAVRGEVDIYGRLAHYEALVQEVTAEMPDLPQTLYS